MEHLGYYLASHMLLEKLRCNNLLHEMPIVQRIGSVTIHRIADGYLGLPIYQTDSLPCPFCELTVRVSVPMIEVSECPFDSQQTFEEGSAQDAGEAIHLVRVQTPRRSSSLHRDKNRDGDIRDPRYSHSSGSGQRDVLDISEKTPNRTFTTTKKEQRG